jgi:hypothetical protein
VDIEFGNINNLDTRGTGWFIGFSEWAKANVAGVPDLRYAAKNSLVHTVHAKWMEHPEGDLRGSAKPPSDGRTISILVSEAGRFQLQFSDKADFPVESTAQYTLENHGDFVIWGENIYHRWSVDAKCVILTFRWIPVHLHDA